MKSAYWLSALLLAACGSDAGNGNIEERNQSQSGDDDEADDDQADDDQSNEETPTKPAKGGKSDGGKTDAGSPKSDASTPSRNDGGGSTPSAGDDRGLPCDVQKIVDAKCTSCHQSTPKFGAPMPLVKWSDFQAKSDEGRAFHEGALARIDGSEKPVMPPPPASLTADEKKTLSDWLSKDAPKSTESCGGGDAPKPDQPKEIGEEDIVDCDDTLELRAGHDKPFSVPTTPDYYHCFYFKPNFEPGTTGKGFLPMIDNDKVIHHWLLFVKDDASKKPGTSEQCTGVNPGATLIAGWAPGGEPTTAPAGVGIQLPQGANTIYQLELHYNNTVGPSATDRSGVKLCTTKKPQKELAAIHYLGSENILILPGATGTAQSTCTPKQKVTLLSVNPHMHKTGSHAKMVITRKNGTKETYHDAPFAFESQINYQKTAVLEPGDTIMSQCTFKNDTSAIKVFQEGTNDEMCYLFTLAYPIGAMDTGSDLLGVGLPGPNRCMR